MPLQNLSQDFLGPSYNYATQIKSPLEGGMSSEGSLLQLADDVGGLIGYIEVLVSGPSNALKNPTRPLGNKYFLPTVANCNDASTNETVQRSLYINNVPVGNIPFLSSVTGVDLSEFRGLAPGILSNMEVLDPIGMMRAVFAGANPDCKYVTFPTIYNNGNDSSGNGYVLLEDLYRLDPCSISGDYVKPEWMCKDGLDYAPCKCTMGFENMNSNNNAKFSNSFYDNFINLPNNINNINHLNNLNNLNFFRERDNNDTFVDVYYIVLALLGLYVLMHLMRK